MNPYDTIKSLGLSGRGYCRLVEKLTGRPFAQTCVVMWKKGTVPSTGHAAFLALLTKLPEDVRCRILED